MYHRITVLDLVLPRILAGQRIGKKELADLGHGGLCMDCQLCFMYCNAGGFTRIEKAGPGHYYALAFDACEGCGKCIELCPCGYLEPRDGASQ